MADTAHAKTDEKLEEMKKRLSAIYSRAEKGICKRCANTSCGMGTAAELLIKFLRRRILEMYCDCKIHRSLLLRWKGRTYENFRN